jgi:hypothetical protein
MEVYPPPRPLPTHPGMTPVNAGGLMAERREVSKGDVHRSPSSSPTGPPSEKIALKLRKYSVYVIKSLYPLLANVLHWLMQTSHQQGLFLEF